MKNSLIKYKVVHQRLVPKRHKFTSTFFWFKVDLDNLKSWPTRFFGHNKLSLYSFYDIDHLNVGEPTLRQNYIKYIQSQGVETEIKSVTLYTQLRFLGYVFNPVSFVLLTDINDKRYAIVEVGNTFNELKPYFVGTEHFNDNGFEIEFKKHFYISPFVDHDTILKLRFKHKADQIKISIDDYKSDELVLKVFLDGKEKAATSRNLLSLTVAVPFVTFKTIFLIHLHALLLWMKGVRFRRKNENKELQKGFIVWKA